jgi:hypothetical protein
MELTIVLGVIAFVSIVLNGLMIWYAKTFLAKVNAIYTASETASEIFSMIDAYKEHLKSVYEKPTFYGDETLKGLLKHTNQMVKYLKKYEEIYSFTQPDLEEQLLAASADLENYDQENTEETQEQ